MEKYLTLKEAATALRLHPKSIRWAVCEGHIPEAIRVPGDRLIRIPAPFVEMKDGRKEEAG